MMFDSGFYQRPTRHRSLYRTVIPCGASSFTFDSSERIIGNLLNDPDTASAGGYTNSKNCRRRTEIVLRRFG
jgi:hypothetical protein